MHKPAKKPDLAPSFTAAMARWSNEQGASLPEAYSLLTMFAARAAQSRGFCREQAQYMLGVAYDNVVPAGEVN